MSHQPAKRKAQDDKSGRKKKKYRSDGTPVWSKRVVEGPGVWVSCVKGKEKLAVGEIYEIFESIADDLWPKTADTDADAGKSDEEDAGISLEELIKRQVSDLNKPRGKHPQQRFANCQTNTPCVLFISCKPPVDAVDLVLKCVKDIKDTGAARMRNIHRIVPVSDSSVANPPEIEAMCRNVFSSFFQKYPDQRFTYKIELRVRNHTTIPRQTMIQTIAGCVPDGHTVDLVNPRIFILVEVFKSICGVSVVEDYYQWHKFNVMEIANKSKKDGGETRVGQTSIKESSRAAEGQVA